MCFPDNNKGITSKNLNSFYYKDIGKGLQEVANKSGRVKGNLPKFVFLIDLKGENKV
ncbi:hypothetical protein I4300191C4_06730 [Solibaculum mannosilyticum]